MVIAFMSKGKSKWDVVIKDKVVARIAKRRGKLVATFTGPVEGVPLSCISDFVSDCPFRY